MGLIHGGEDHVVVHATAVVVVASVRGKYVVKTLCNRLKQSILTFKGSLASLKQNSTNVP